MEPRKHVVTFCKETAIESAAEEAAEAAIKLKGLAS